MIRTFCLIHAFLAAVIIVGCVKPPEKIKTTGTDEAPAELVKLARTDHVALLEKCLANYRRNYQDFKCTFVKQERVGGVLKEPQWIDVKFLGKPFSVAMKWTKNAPLANRLIYVEGKYDGMMLVRPKSGLIRALLGEAVLRTPDGPDAMKNTRRPVTMFGFERGLDSLLEVYRKAKLAGDLKQSYEGTAEIDGRRTIVLKRYLPDGKGYPAKTTIVYIDLEYLVPTGIEGFGWKDEFTSRYVYRDVRFNVGLTEKDFLPASNGMKPPKKIKSPKTKPTPKTHPTKK